jgi:hypothetical protein
VETKAIKAAVLLVILTCTASSFMVPPYAAAIPIPTISVDPSSIIDTSLTAGSNFTVNLAIADANMSEDTEVYSWQVHMVWNTSILDINDTISWGDFLEGPRIGPWGTLTSDAPAAQNIVNVADGSRFTPGYTVLIQDDTNSEINTVAAVSGNQLTMQTNLAHTYVAEANGGCYPDPNTTYQYNINHSLGRVIVGVTTQGPAPGQSGSGWLASLTFHVLAEGETLLNISSPHTYIINDVLATIGDEEGELYKEGGFFSNTASPPTTYDLTISVAGSGTTAPAPGVYSFVEGTVVDVYAFPDSGWMLDHWELNSVVVGASAPYSIVIDADHLLTAFFVEIPPEQWTLQVNSDPINSIEFAVNGASHVTPWSGLLDENSHTIVMPSAWMLDGDIYSFDHWEDSSTNPTRTVNLISDTTVTAHFALELPPPGESVLTIVVVGSGTTDPAPGVYMHPDGSVVDVNAVPDSDWLLDHWELDNVDLGATDPYSVTMNANHILTAFFIDVHAPIADAGPDQTVTEDVPMTFDGSASYDEDGIVNYTWSFTDLAPQTLNGMNPSYTFATPSTYYVTLTVENAVGNSANDTVVITVLLDTDRDGTPDVTDLDDDNDGMPDTWESQNGLNPLDSTDASADPDEDGVTNLEEYQNDTDPNTNNSQASSIDVLLPGILIAAALVGAGLILTTLLWRRASRSTRKAPGPSAASASPRIL